MVRCSANGNGCEAEGKTWCACIYVPSEGLCLCKNDVAGILNRRNFSKAQKKHFRLDTKIGFNAHNASLFEIGDLLDRCFPYYELAVPVAKAKKKVNLRVRDGNLGSLLRELGLMMGVPVAKAKK